MTRHGQGQAPRHAAVAGGARPAGPRHLRPSSSARPAGVAPGGRSRYRRGALVVVGTVALGLVAGPAFAYFTAGGVGAGAGSTTTLQPLAVSSAVPASSLLPGTTADLSLTVHNPNGASLTITGLSQAGGVTVSGGSGCTGDPSWPGSLGTSGVVVPTLSGLGIVVGGGATVTVHLAGASMSTASATGCQGASFQIPVAVAVQQ